MYLFDLSGKVAVVTGGTRGIGMMMARGLLQAGASVSRHGGDIQFSGLYEPPSECTSTEPSALTMSRRRASGRWAVSRPT